MGVIRKSVSHNSFDNEFIDDILDIISDVNTVEHDDTSVPTNGRVGRRSDRNQRNARRNQLRPEPTFRGLGIRGKSYKKHRRYANANLLFREYESLTDGEELNDISIYDFIPQTVSAFAQLLMDEENINSLNDIINCTEEKQEEILDNRETNKRKNQFSFVNNKVDKNGTQSPYSADECFKRIDDDLKAMFKKQRIPIGVLTKIEEEITNFFNNKPIDIYKSQLPSGYQRLLLHACAQYLDLKCQSFNENDQRWSKVTNRNDFFNQPNMSLAKYLEMRNKSNYKSIL